MWRSGRALSALMILAMVVLMIGCGDDNGTEPANETPEITRLSTAFPVVQAGGVLTLACTAADPDGDELFFEWACPSGVLTWNDGDAIWSAPAEGGTYTISVTVTDVHGDHSTQSIEVEVVAGTLLIKTRDGLVAADFTGGGFLLRDYNGTVEVLGTRIFLKGTRSVLEIDHQGESVNTVWISDSNVRGYNFFMLPDAGFAFVSNSSDSMYFMDAGGIVQHRDILPGVSEGDDHLQSIFGRVVGNRLIISETGHKKLAQVDLDTYEASIFRDFDNGKGWIGALHHQEGMFYLAGCTLVRKFTETGPEEDLCTVEDEGCLSGLTWAGGYLWGVINTDGLLYRIDPNTGEVVTILEGLNYPEDLEFLPVVLEEPVEP